MESEESVYSHCQNCGRWFRVGIRFATAEEFIDAKIRKRTVDCPFCGKNTLVEKQYLRFDEQRIDGHITHVEGRYFV